MSSHPAAKYLRKCPSDAAGFPFSSFATPGRAPRVEIIVECLYSSAYEALHDGDYERAQRLFTMMAIAAPRDERPWTGLALVREAAGDWRGAAGLYEVGVALAPNSARCHLGRARAMKHMGRYEDADRSLDTADASTTDPTLLLAIAEERTMP